MPTWTEDLPEWNNEGVEPSPAKKAEGWLPEEKPPAGWFNWFFNRAYECIKEIRDKLHLVATTGSYTDLENVPSDFTPSTHAIGGSAHSADTLANLNARISDATLDDVGDKRVPEDHGNEAHTATYITDTHVHTVGGAYHSADTLANFNMKISDANLDAAGTARPPTSHDNTAHDVNYITDTQSHGLGSATYHSAATLSQLNYLISDATLDDVGGERTAIAHALGGNRHTADTLANLNSKISDANLDAAGTARPPTSHGNEAHSVAYITDPTPQASSTAPVSPTNMDVWIPFEDVLAATNTRTGWSIEAPELISIPRQVRIDHDKRCIYISQAQGLQRFDLFNPGSPVWSATVTNSQSRPVVNSADGRFVYTNNDAGGLSILQVDADTGAVLYDVGLGVPGATLIVALALSDDGHLLLVGTSGGHLVCFDTRTMRKLWTEAGKYNLSYGEIPVSPCGRYCYGRDAGGHVIEVDILTGDTVWTSTAAPGTGGTMTSDPSKKVIYVATDSVVQAICLRTDTVIWTYDDGGGTVVQLACCPASAVMYGVNNHSTFGGIFAIPTDGTGTISAIWKTGPLSGAVRYVWCNQHGHKIYVVNSLGDGRQVYEMGVEDVSGPTVSVNDYTYARAFRTTVWDAAASEWANADKY